MKVGDLVKCKGDTQWYFGHGIILECRSMSRMVFVYWADDKETEWLWKAHLEIIN